MIGVEVFKSFCPLRRWAKDAEIEIEFGHPKDIGFCIFEGCAYLSVFVTLCIDW